MTRPDRLESVALQIADGDDVQWTGDDAHDTSAVLTNLRVLDTLSRILRKETADVEAPGNWGGLEILAHLGSGASADVFRAHDPALQRDVALKLFRSRDPEHQQRMLDEGRLMARVRHPNVVQVFGVAQHDGRTGIWMELIEGQDLDQLIESNGPQSAAETALVGQQLCSALAAVHEAGLIFRDMKAQNVIRERGGTLKLTDFGSGIHSNAVPTDRISGTPFYLAPELLEGAAASPRSDIYALGVLLYRLSTGQFPVEAETIDGLAAAHRRGPRHALDARADLPAGFAATLDKAIATDPEGRFATPGAFAAALRKPINRFGISRRRAIGTLVIIALAVAAVLAWPTGYVVETTLTRVDTDNGRATLDNGDAVGVGDRLSLELTASAPLYVYVFNEDSRGNAFGLFPLESVGHELPLSAGVPHVLPATGDDNLAWTVDSIGGTERIHIVASPDPMPDVAARFAELPPAALGGTGFDSRGIGSLSRQASAPRVSAAALIQAAEALSGQAEADSGITYRIIELQNAGPAPTD